MAGRYRIEQQDPYDVASFWYVFSIVGIATIWLLGVVVRVSLTMVKWILVQMGFPSFVREERYAEERVEMEKILSNLLKSEETQLLFQEFHTHSN